LAQVLVLAVETVVRQSQLDTKQDIVVKVGQQSQLVEMQADASKIGIQLLLVVMLVAMVKANVP
jgi:peptidyl-tRNA hydrolase